jgi:hypothetical protein
LWKKILSKIVETGNAIDQIPNPANMKYGWSNGAINTPKIPTAPLAINSDRLENS